MRTRKPRNRDRELPRRVYAKHGSYYFVDIDYRWHKLCRVDQGVAKMYTELAKRLAMPAADRLPAAVATFKLEYLPTLAVSTRKEHERNLEAGLARGFRAPQLAVALDASFVILGTGTPKYEGMWRNLAAAHPSRIAVTVGFSEELAHLIEGGADIFLMPSRFEPCGLNQMYSLRYGTVPVVRATGEGTGFKFRAHTSEAMMEALHRALAWFARPAAWRRIQLTGMAQDNSWEASAREYVDVYHKARERAARG